MEGPALAIMVPLLMRGLREETSIKRKSCVIITNMSKLVNSPLDAARFLPRLLPGVKLVADAASDPEVRGWGGGASVCVGSDPEVWGGASACVGWGGELGDVGWGGGGQPGGIVSACMERVCGSMWCLSQGKRGRGDMWCLSQGKCGRGCMCPVCEGSPRAAVASPEPHFLLLCQCLSVFVTYHVWYILNACRCPPGAPPGA